MTIVKKIESIARIIKVDKLTPEEKYRNIRQTLLIGENRTKEEVFSSIFMVIVGMLLIVFMVGMESIYYETQQIGGWKMRTVLALAGGAMAVGFSGNINIKFHWVQASGSLAVVLLIFLVDPGSLEKSEGKPSSLKTINNDGTSLLRNFFLSSAYAQTGEATEKNDDTESSTVGGASALTEIETAPAVVNYNFKITYPIGVSELKSESFRLGEILVASEEPNDVEVYSIGSIFRAPVNALIYNENYNIKIKYNRLVDIESVASVVKSLGSAKSYLGSKIEASEAVLYNSDILIELQPM
ncbi:MAG: hypothetical protein COA42_11595 [Alteromonadaceae bacterium]|nr:MAG: hypothetical protein COA42_11595 [Alteromonadaceae bacterium]